jgi:hypothetical protein
VIFSLCAKLVEVIRICQEIFVCVQFKVPVNASLYIDIKILYRP